jgi:hypothetical protein
MASTRLADGGFTMSGPYVSTVLGLNVCKKKRRFEILCDLCGLRCEGLVSTVNNSLGSAP